MGVKTYGRLFCARWFVGCVLAVVLGISSSGAWAVDYDCTASQATCAAANTNILRFSCVISDGGSDVRLIDNQGGGSAGVWGCQVAGDGPPPNNDPCSVGYTGTGICTNPTQADCAANMSLPGCISTDPCVTDPTAPQCSTEPYCKIHPADPSCLAPQPYCDLHPTDPACVDPAPYCKLHPDDASCVSPDPYCKVHPDDSACQGPVPYCSTHPAEPACMPQQQSPPWCAAHPADPACLPLPQNPPYCATHPDDAACKDSSNSAPWCEAHADDPACINEANHAPWCKDHPDDVSCHNPANEPGFCDQPANDANPACPQNQPGTMRYCALHPTDLACVPSANFCHANPNDAMCKGVYCQGNPSDPICIAPPPHTCDPATDPNCADDGNGDDLCKAHPDSAACQVNTSSGGTSCSSPPSGGGDQALTAVAYQAWRASCQSVCADKPNLAACQDKAVQSGGGDCTSPGSCTGDPGQCSVILNTWKIACGKATSATGGGSCSDPPVITGDQVMQLLATQAFRARCDLEGVGPVPDDEGSGGHTPGEVTEQKAFSVGDLDGTGWLGGGTCPDFGSITPMTGVTWNLGSISFCNFFLALGGLFQLLCAVKALHIALAG